MANTMLQPTRMIGGKRFNVRRYQNYLGADFLVVADVTASELATLGEPLLPTTYILCQGKLYRWLNNSWVDFYPFGGGPAGKDGMSAYDVAVMRGYSGTQEQWLASLKGEQGEMGARGDVGPAGPSNSLTIGTVRTLPTGSNANASVIGTPPSQILNLDLPRGAAGTAGPGNTLSIGTVTSGPAAATITGTAPNQVLNLVLPPGADGAQGSPGPNGVTPNITIGTVATIAAGGNATASLSGTAPNYSLNLGLPTGAKGADGATPILSVGAVTTLAAGSSATASISGGTLTFGIPRGADGASSALTMGTVSTLSPGSTATAGIVSGKLNLGIPGSKRIDTYVGVTDANGLYTVTYPTPFPDVPSVQPIPPALASQAWTVVSSTAAGFSLRLNQRNVVSLLGIEVLLGATVNVSGAAARVTVIQA